MVDLDFEVWNLVEIEDMISWDFENHLFTYVDAFLFILLVLQGQSTKITTESNPIETLIDCHLAIEQFQLILEMFRFLNFSLRDD